MLTRPALGGLDVISSLEHFAIITYAVPPERLRPHVDSRFDLDCIPGLDGEPRALVSMVPFEDRDFRFVRCPWPRFRMGQTNYRAYVIDRVTGEHGVWFFGTTLGSWTVAIPRYGWKLPWHAGRVRFDCVFDEPANRYSSYRMMTRSAWAPVGLQIEDSGQRLSELTGFPDLEMGRIILTHPFSGWFYRRDGKLGSYRVWHEPLRLTTCRLIRAEIGLFVRLGLVRPEELLQPHSVLVQRVTEFAIKLPPRALRWRAPNGTNTSAAAPTHAGPGSSAPSPG
jgi:Uncharacterized conserved protein (COG2071)